MHGFSAVVFATSTLLLLLLPACHGQLLNALRLRNPLSSLFGQRGGDPDSDVSDGRTELEKDPLPDMIPRAHNAPTFIYRSSPSMVMEAASMGDAGRLYLSRPMPYVLGQRARLDQMPPFNPHVQVAPPVRQPQRSVGDYTVEDRPPIGRPQSATRDLNTHSAEDRIIEALRLFKQLRNMAQ